MTKLKNYSEEEIKWVKEHIDTNRRILTQEFNKTFRYELYLTNWQKPVTQAAMESLCYRIKKGEFDDIT